MSLHLLQALTGCCAALLLCSCVGCDGYGTNRPTAQTAVHKNNMAAELGELSAPMLGDELMYKVEAQLINALEMLHAYQEGAAPSLPMKFAEKRRNKFEFIRFGRRR